MYLKDNHTVVKSRSLIGYLTIVDALESMEIHNWLFPETAMNVLAFGRSEGEMVAVFEQPYIYGAYASNCQIEQYVARMFDAVKDKSVIGGTSYKNEAFLLQDLKPKNVLQTVGADGELRLYVIDGDFYYTSEYKRFRTQ